MAGSPLAELPSGHRLVVLDDVDSTNAEAMRRADSGDRGPLFILAERQCAGRGRSGRTWESQPGNLFATLLLPMSARAMGRAYQLSLVAGVAACEAIAATTKFTAGESTRLKWPNDVLIAGRKAGGILVESSTAPAGPFAAIGFGLNLVSAPDAPAQLATHLAAHAAAPSKEILLSALSVAVAAWLARWQEGDGFDIVRSAWLEWAGALGERCSVHLGSSRLSGRFAGLDETGALLIEEESGAVRRVTYGDVTLAP